LSAPPDDSARDEVGLCRTCVHSRTVTTPRTVYWRCRLSASDPRFPKYPRLPVLACDGYRRREEPGRA
jgi:hypothetical protein